METILATAFGRAVDVQRGESDSLTDAASDIANLTANRLLIQCIFSMFLVIMCRDIYTVTELTFAGNFPWIDPLVAHFMQPSKSFSLIYSVLLSVVRDRRANHQGNKV